MKQSQLSDILVPSNVNKANIWNMYKTQGKTVVPAVGNDIYMNSIIFNVDDPAGFVAQHFFFFPQS